MTEYLSIGQSEQSSMIKSLKKESGLTWKRIWEELGVNRSMVYFYRSGKCRIPQEKLEKLFNLAGRTPSIDSLPFVSGNYSLQSATIATMNESMAEFLGVLYGDGCLGNSNYLIDVSGDSRSDFLYHTKHIKPLISALFGLEPRFHYAKKSHGMHTLLTSKIVHTHLSSVFSFPIGYKKGRMTVPKEIYLDNNYKRAFLRGLFDTDGGVHRHHKHSIQVHYTSMDPAFLFLVWKLFLELGFNAKLGKEDIWILDRHHVIRFFDEVKPANPKHVYKFNQYLETGIVPRNRDIDYGLLNAGTGN